MHDGAIRGRKAAQFRVRTEAEKSQDRRAGKTGRAGSVTLAGAEFRNDLPEFVPYRWQQADQRRDAEVAQQLEDIREQVARNWKPGPA